MADTYEHDRPYQLTADYLDAPIPSELSAPYDLHAVYNGTLGGGEQYVNAIGFDAVRYGQPHAVFKQYIAASGFNAESYGSPLAYNLRQYISHYGFDASVYGTAYLQGGVKYLYPYGFDAQDIPYPKVINTTADQYIHLYDKGIDSPALPTPNVSPRILYPAGFRSDSYGQPLIQRSPMPDGFTADSYGIAWVSHNPRYLGVASIDSFDTGYPRIYDPTQTIYLADKGIEGGVFGDISAKNTRRLLNLTGFDTQDFSKFATVESNLRAALPKGFDAAAFGSNTIHNKTPSVALTGFDSLQGLLPAVVGYRIRTVYPSGFDLLQTGQHALSQPPALKPTGFDAQDFGIGFVSNRVRTLATAGKNSQEFGEHSIWYRYRVLSPDSFSADAYGQPRMEHGRRTLLPQGSTHTEYGNPWLSFARRTLAPISIEAPNIPIHQVGGTRQIQPQGYVATAFGSRIIPEIQSVYPQGFTNSYGVPVVDWHTRYIRPRGFLAAGQESVRFGVLKAWNLRQYIEQYFDVNSGLAPPKWTGWTGIENRNKAIGAIGYDMSRVAEPAIENAARPLLPIGFDAQAIGQVMMAYRIRWLGLDGIEPPYLSGWAAVYNAAAVIAPQGFNAQGFGSHITEKTRRYYERVGNFDSLVMGLPMISDRIRTLAFEERYSIQPPVIAAPNVGLWMRYIEEVGRGDYQAFGQPALSIHWSIITPRWTMRDVYGEPTVKNVTPELGAYGYNSEEFGQAAIRTQWRELQQQGSETVLWGKSDIAFRDRKFSVPGFTQWNIPTHKVTKTGVPPYYPQYIWLDAVEIDGEKIEGYGIGPLPSLKEQVSKPALRTNVVFPIGFIATEYGSHYTQSNGILVQPGLQELTVGLPNVGLRNRGITVPTLGDMAQIEMTRPRLSPHTIYAVVDAPGQAQGNHPLQNLHYVNSDGGSRLPGEVFGRADISLQHRTLQAGIGDMSRMSDGHKLELRKRYINLTNYGFRSQRMGFHVVGPFDQTIQQYESKDHAVLGELALSIPNTGTQYVNPESLAAFASGRTSIEFLNRTIVANGFDGQTFGNAAPPDNPFMWQGMRVGERVLGCYGGFGGEEFGDTFISNKIRDIKLAGFDTFKSEYDPTSFSQRMRVTGTPMPKPVKAIAPVGFEDTRYGVPNIMLGVHYIRPDGNSEQYRKGAPHGDN